MRWTTRMTRALPCRVPIMGAPMSGVSGGLLASETCRAGGLGFVGAGHTENLESLDKQVQLFRKNCDKNTSLALGFISHSSFKHGPDLIDSVLSKYKPSVVQYCAPAVVTFDNGSTNVDLARQHGAQVMVQVGTEEEAKVAIDAGVDVIIAQGGEAGGHGMRPDLANGTLALSARIVSLARASPSNPLVLAAGGIVDGRGLAAALALGCDGVVLGTRLWASKEAMGHDSFKQQLASPLNGPDQVIRTTVIDQIANTTMKTPWPQPYDSTGSLRNSTTEKWHGREQDLAATLESATIAQDYKKAVTEGDHDVAAVYSGQGVGEINSIDGAYDIISRISKEALEIVLNMPKFVQ